MAGADRYIYRQYVINPISRTRCQNEGSVAILEEGRRTQKIAVMEHFFAFRLHWRLRFLHEAALKSKQCFLSKLPLEGERLSLKFSTTYLSTSVEYCSSRCIHSLFLEVNVCGARREMFVGRCVHSTSILNWKKMNELISNQRISGIASYYYKSSVAIAKSMAYPTS